MQSEIETIVDNYSKQLKLVDKTKSISLIVKEIDGIITNMYKELYGLRDIRHTNYSLNNSLHDNKKGHCS